MSEGDNDRLNAPGSNPGSDDPSGGIATGSGGVSSAAYVLSPVPNEQKSVMQSTVDTATAAVETVKSYLPSLASLSFGGGNTEEEQEARNAGEGGAAVGGGAVAVAAASTAAATAGQDNAPTDSADQTATTTAKDEAMTDSDPKDGDKVTDEANQKAKVMDQEKSSDIATTDRENEERTAKTDTEGAPPGAGNEGSEMQEGSEMKKMPTGNKENPSAIPTAGGERLGEKHWGESKQVPDLPPKRESEGGAQVSSHEGQPDKATKDNTAQNTGGAAPPSSSAADGDEGKQSLKEKVKEKLNIGSKKD